MRALIRVRHRRALVAIAAAGAAVVSVVACEPAAGDALSSVAVAVTTDKTGTSTLERIGFDVRWLSCTAKVDGGVKATRTGAPSASPARSAATVDCQGKTGSGEDITLKGKVTEERSGRCVRGELISRVAGKVVFEATMLGNCDAAPTRTTTRTPSRTATRTPTRTPSERPQPTVTVTVTRTATPR
jgi:hypothetical protein